MTPEQKELLCDSVRVIVSDVVPDTFHTAGAFQSGVKEKIRQGVTSFFESQLRMPVSS